MNNNQFRKLVLANSEQPASTASGSPPSTGGQTGKGSLGSRERATIPMTPRSVASAQSVFARQLAERNQAVNPHKKFKTSAPKGVKLASGYVDRSSERHEETADDRKEKLESLEKSLRNGEIDRETYDKLRFDIAGGSLESTHLVKGLDFKLLERIKRGDNVYGKKAKDEAKDDGPGTKDIEDEFEELEQREVQAIEKVKQEKKTGQLATVPAVSGKKRTRDQILAELKASREAAKAPKVSSLGSRFKRIGTKHKPGARIERDSKGREVLIIVDEDGHEKRKVRKLKPGEEEDEAGNGLLMPDPKAKPLGMEVPEEYRKQAEPEEDLDADIFSDVGDDYDPLAGLEASDSDSDSDSDADGAESKASGMAAEASGEHKEKDASNALDREKMPPPPKPKPTAAPRNYFQDSKTGLMSTEATQGPSMSDPAIMAAIKRAAALGPVRGDGDDDDDKTEEKAREMEERRKKLLQMSARDDEDIDMGFGTSRFEDEDDFDEQRVKLSVWGAEAGGQGQGQNRSGQSRRKRGPKKRKGDANSAADVMRVMEERKKS
ncbi:hypothetical protein CDD83_10681 [Cordyceps sp. RAO-2017]|nr:hypothetical protein CDD83_10681 [Cordyceps sp. RAO-2017]